ncbi:hypothetical protein [Paenibacillus whitsoniae]|uniref:DUF2157 domain-containing protein n=1 Tax=Paenibacillus whitsoniae TaxID=2496558 RepID=A0A430J9W3_9BACL|nr:hypothetical protein [Paenibacillus whitsoniae]RTE07720.1 hypothetical protein EJQ19_20810 [Paenibacillus whitsoniae]
MDAEKRTMIVREIERWRRSKLLPEHYCDFLLNLYGDDTVTKQASILGITATTVTNSSWKIWLAIVAIITAVALSALNFNSFALPMQIGVSALLVILCYGLAYRERTKKPIVAYVLCGVSSVAMLLLGIYILYLAGVHANAAYISYLALCSMIWLFNGLIGRMAIFQICGWLGLVGTYGWLLLQRLEHPAWFTLEISWLPVSIVLIWMAWLAHHTNKQAAGVLMLIGCLVWFMPEAMTFVLDANMSVRIIQLSFAVKLVTAGAALFALRKKWVEWVM